MRIGKLAILLGVAALMIGSTANGTTPDVTTVVAKLKEKHDSGVYGTATLTAADEDVRVVLTLNKRVRGGALAHIHTGACRNEPTFANPRLYKDLNNAVRGKSVTIVIGTTLASLRARTFSINVHDPSSYRVLACADIPRG